MTWRVAVSLNVLLTEVNASAPRRSKASDGSIGDAAHATRSSDHNPWVKDSRGVGVVRARDFTHDPAGGLDAGALAEAIADLLGKHPALGSGAYVIWNRRIISTNRLAEGWRSYSGSNQHTSHVHISVGTSGYDSDAQWLTPPEPPSWPKRVARYLREQKANRQAVNREIKRLKAARKVARSKGEDLTSYRDALKHARKARRQLRLTRQAAKNTPKRSS